MSRVRPIHVAVVGLPFVAGLLAVLALLSASLAPVVMSVGAGAAVLSAGISLASVIGTRFRRAWAALAVSVGVAAVVADPLVRTFTRSLQVSPADALAPFAMLALAGFLLRRPPVAARAAYSAVLAVVLASGTVVSGAFGQAWDPVTLVLWTGATAGLGLMLAVVILGVLGSERVSPRLLLLASAGCLLVPASAARQYAVYSVGDIGSAFLSAALVSVSVAAFVILAVGLAVSAAPAAVRGRAYVRIPAVLALSVGTIFSGSAAALPLEVSELQGVTTARVASPSEVLGGGGAMLSELGAMPRDEFRGLDFAECDARNSRDCFITIYDDIALRDGVGAAIEDVLQKVKDSKGATFPAHCHQVVHNLGQLAFTLAEEFEDAAALDPQVCGTGYTHGLWEQQFVLLGDAAMFTRTSTLCDELNMTTPWYKWTCSHILGHMIVTRMMDSPSLALEYCDLITDSQSLTDCEAGGWMNFFQDDKVIAEMVNRGSLRDLFSVCYGTADAVKFMCYQELFPVIYPMVGGDDYLAAQACLTYSERRVESAGDAWTWNTDFADRCIQGLARAVTVSAFEDHRIVGPRCLSMPEPAHDPCLTAAAASVVLNTGSTSAAFELCRLVSLESYRVYCYFWSKHSRKLLANGPNSDNLPEPGEYRLPESPRWAPSEPVPSPRPSGSAPAG